MRGKTVTLFTALFLSGCLGEGITMGQRPETCNRVDDDSDGTVDLDLNGFPLLRDCSNVCGDGVEECVDGAWAYCSAPQPVTASIRRSPEPMLLSEIM